MKVNGKVKVIGETVTFDSGFTKRVLVLTTDEKYPQHIPIEFVKESISKLDTLTIGQDVSVEVNLRGNEYNDKYYLSLNGWRIDEQTSELPTTEAQESEDLPF